MRTVWVRSASSLFIAACATLMCYETGAVTGTPIHLFAPAVVFICALLAYTVSCLNISFNFGTGDPVTVQGSTIHLAVAAGCIIALLPLCTFLDVEQALWLSFAAALSFYYMIPVSYPGRKITPARKILPAKNIILSLVWTITTVIIPSDPGTIDILSGDLMLVMVRRFLFIYCLATLYDLPDTHSDRQARVGSISARFNQRTAIIIASGALFLFMLLTLFDRHIDTMISAALVISAVYTFCIITFINPERSRQRYRLLVDSAMAMQALLVMAA